MEITALGRDFVLGAERFLPVIVLLPLFGAVWNGFAKGSLQSVRRVAIGSVAASFLLALFCFFRMLDIEVPEVAEGETSHFVRRLAYEAYTWFHITLPSAPLDPSSAAEFGARIPVRVGFVMDPLSGIMTLVVTGIGLLIHIYAAEYMKDDAGFARFFAYLNLFMASMLILVLGSNLPLMFVGWEGVGLCSYLLIGYWWENPTYALAGKKAFITNRIGDLGVLIGMFLLVVATQSFEFTEINGNVHKLGGPVHIGSQTISGVTIATAAALFLFLGCAGKSAQIPLYVWLPDAMAGPTPVSALIHAATMVTAGVYLTCRLSPVFAASPTAMAVIAIVGATTALLAASIALVQNQMKKILAYSTVSQLGFMFAAVGVGAFGAGIFHVFTHAFFKACLFLGAGSVMHAVHAHGDADIRELGGLKKWMPITRWTFLLSCLAIAGFPLTSGFFSKDEILLGAFVAHTFEGFPSWVGWAVFGMLVLTAFMTAFYMFRLYFRTFEGAFKGAAAHAGEHTHADHAHDDSAHSDHAHDAHHAHAEPHESPGSMTIPLALLATGAVFAGFLGLPHAFGLPNFWGHFLEPVLASVPRVEHFHETAGMAATVMAIGTAAGLGGIGLAYVWYFRASETPANLQAQFPKLHALLMDKWRVDELYEAVLLRPLAGVARLSAAIDRDYVDGILAKATAHGVQAAGWLASRAQGGIVHGYAAVMVLGFALGTWWFAVPHASLAAERKGLEVKYTAAGGYGYEYRWDMDGNGVWDSEWSKDERAHEVKYENTPRTNSFDVRPSEALHPRSLHVSVLEQDGTPAHAATFKLTQKRGTADTIIASSGHASHGRTEYHSVRGHYTLEVTIGGDAFTHEFDVDPDHGTQLEMRRPPRHGGLILAPMRPDRDPDELLLEEGAWLTLIPSRLGANWQRRDDKGNPVGATPPAVLWKNGTLVIRPNDGAVALNGEPKTEQFEAPPGSSLEFGSEAPALAALVANVVTVRLQARNPLGYVSEDSARVLLLPEGGGGGVDVAHAGVPTVGGSK